MRRTWAAVRPFLPAIAVVLGLLTAVNSVLVVIGFGRIKDQAKAGQEAKRVQCLRNPVSQKLALAAYAVRHSLPFDARVTEEELADFKRTAPRDCAGVKK